VTPTCMDCKHAYVHLAEEPCVSCGPEYSKFELTGASELSPSTQRSAATSELERLRAENAELQSAHVLLMNIGNLMLDNRLIIKGDHQSCRRVGELSKAVRVYYSEHEGTWSESARSGGEG
jgi:hypothetical protein